MSKIAQRGVIDPKIIIGGIVVLAVIFFLSTGKFKFSASRSDQPSPSQTETQTEQPKATSALKSYQNDQYGFSLEYPSDWTVKEGEGGYVATFLSPAETPGDKYFEFLGVKVVRSSKPGITAQEAADLWEQQTVAGTKEDSNLQIVDKSTSSIAGEEAKTIVYTVDLDKISSKGSVTVTVKNNNVYIFQYFAEADKYEKFLPDVEGIISSVTL